MAQQENRKFNCTHVVRGYELDAYGHVNNAVYLNYAEYARWCMIEEAAGSMNYFKDNGIAPVVARVEIDYKKPCYLGERLRIQTTLLEYRKKVSIFEHQIFKNENELASVIRATVVVVNVEGKVVEMKDDFYETFGAVKGSAKTNA